jgi:hypothetical protein
MEDLKRSFEKHDLVVTNPNEEDRLESIAIAKLRGKGPPKKKREKNSEYDLRNGEVVMLMCARISDEAKEKEIVTHSAIARISGVFIDKQSAWWAFLTGTAQNGIVFQYHEIFYSAFDPCNPIFFVNCIFCIATFVLISTLKLLCHHPLPYLPLL